jgi:hypothetical protein
MKNSIVRTLVTLSLGALLSPLALLAQEQLNASIPFAFTVGTKSFAAGNYSIHQLNAGHTLLIRNDKDGSGVMAMVMNGQQSQKAGTSVLSFKRYGDRYFLSEIRGDEQGWLFFQSAAEKELIVKTSAAQPGVEVAAFRAK